MKTLVVLGLLGCSATSGGEAEGGDTSAETAEGGDGDGDLGDDDDDEDDGGTGEADDGGNDSMGGSDGGDETGGAQPEPPHSLGTIALTESHPAEGGSSVPSVAIAFVPEAAAVPDACTQTVGPCEVALLPECVGGCMAGEACLFGPSCQAECTPICDLQCGPDEICQAADAGFECVPIPQFDAGGIVLSGTTIPISVFPPYGWDGPDTGSPFSPGADLSVTAAGATTEGFLGFEASWTATTLMSSTLADLTREQVLTAASIPIAWPAGTDQVIVSGVVQAPGSEVRSFRCDVDDTAGAFGLPRAVIDAAAGGATPSSITMAVARVRTETVTGIPTTIEFPPEGWVELSTRSSESRTVQGCSSGTAVCDEACVDTSSDPENCGDCDVSCAPDELCEAGDCVFDDGCKGPRELCFGECVDTEHDFDHCGRCGNQCDDFESCEGGDCVAPGGDPVYPPATEGCPDTHLSAFGVCAPPCTPDCPEGNTGNADPQCLVFTGGDPEPTHCALVCQFGQTCPDEMECGKTGTCRYP